MKKYRKKSWKEYKRKNNISSKRLVKQHVVMNLFREILCSEYVAEESFDWLRSKKGRLMKVDAYFPEFNLVIEYDGEQHYMPVQWYGRKKANAIEAFERQKKRDLMKNQLILNGGLKLIRIKYDEPVTKIHLRKRLFQSGIFTIPT